VYYLYNDDEACIAICLDSQGALEAPQSAKAKRSLEAEAKIPLSTFNFISISQIIAFDKGVHVINALFLVISANTAISRTLPETGFFGLYFCLRKCRPSFNLK